MVFTSRPAATRRSATPIRRNDSSARGTRRIARECGSLASCSEILLIRRTATPCWRSSHASTRPTGPDPTINTCGVPGVVATALRLRFRSISTSVLSDRPALRPSAPRLDQGGGPADRALCHEIAAVDLHIELVAEDHAELDEHEGIDLHRLEHRVGRQPLWRHLKLRDQSIDDELYDRIHCLSQYGCVAPCHASGGSVRATSSSGQISAVDPQVKPPPNAVRTTRSPALMMPAESVSASGIDAAQVLPTRSRLMTTLSRIRRIWSAIAWRMRTLA